MKRRSGGFSLIELMVAVGIFSILAVLIFSFFRFGARSFQTANNKQGLQMDALRSMESLQRELKRSNLSSVSVLDGSAFQATTTEGTVQRNGISFVTLQDWKAKTDPNNFDLHTQAPLWNRYLLYYATRPDIGHLIRLRVDPNPAPTGAIELPQDDLDLLTNNDPTLNTFDGDMPPYTVLTKNVLEFSVVRRTNSAGQVTGEFESSLKLKQKKSKGPTGPGPARPFDYYEIKLVVRPENSYPNDL